MQNEHSFIIDRYYISWNLLLFEGECGVSMAIHTNKTGESVALENLWQSVCINPAVYMHKSYILYV